MLSLFKEDRKSLIAFAQRIDSDKGVTNIDHIEDIYCACIGECDRSLQEQAQLQRRITGWRNISDLVSPIGFLHFIFAIINRLRDGRDVYTDEAYKKLKQIIMVLAQKALRFTTEEERRRVIEVLGFPF